MFTGKTGQTVFLNVRSAAFEPTVSLRSPDGVHLAADNKGNAATGSLLALRLPNLRGNPEKVKPKSRAAP